MHALRKRRWNFIDLSRKWKREEWNTLKELNWNESIDSRNRESKSKLLGNKWANAKHSTLRGTRCKIFITLRVKQIIVMFIDRAESI